MRFKLVLFFAQLDEPRAVLLDHVRRRLRDEARVVEPLPTDGEILV